MTLFGLGVAAVIVLAIYTYRRSGSVLVRWVLVGTATGIAYPIALGGFGHPGFLGQGGTVWLAIGAAVAGGVVGTTVSRLATVPWDGLALAALALALVLPLPLGRAAFAKLAPILGLSAAFVIGFALAVALTALAAQTLLPGGPGEVATLVGLGFVASLLATVVVFPASLLGRDRASLVLGPVLTIALVAVGVFSLYGRGRRAGSPHRPIGAEGGHGAT
jgi:hypothetical protein